MNRRFYLTLVLFVSALTSLCLVKPTPILADVDTDAALNVQVTLVSDAHISQGEPILLHYQVTNSTSQILISHLGVYDTDWYTLELTDAQGKPTVSIPDTRPTEPSGLQITADRIFAPGDSIKGDIIVTSRFTLAHPGKYLLTLRTHPRSAFFSTDDVSPQQRKQILKISGTAEVKTFSFPLTVTNTDISRLQKTAEALRQEIIQQRSARVETLADALFSMPEAQAASSWEELANNPAYTLLVAGKLGHVNTAKAADILVQILRNPNVSPNEVRVASKSMNEIYNNGDALLKSHIRGIAAGFGIALPEKVAIPIGTD